MDGNSCKRNRRMYNNKEEESGQFCNRIGCNGRLKYSGIGSRPSSQLEPPSTRSSSRVVKIIPTSSRTRSGQLQVNKREGIGSLGAQRKDMPKNQSGSSVSSGDSSRSSSSSSTGSMSRSSGSGSRYGLRSLNCSSISDVVPRGGGGGSSSESKSRRELLKKRIPEEGGSSLSSRGKRSSVAPSRDDHVSSLRRTGKVSDQASSTSSVLTRRSGRLSVNADAGVPRLNRDSMSVTGFRSIIPRSSRPQVRNIANRPMSSLRASYPASSSYAAEQVGDDSPSMETLRSSGHDVAQGLRRHNLNGAAEILLALERLEQDEELTYEQLLALENNLFFGNLYFYDQHRDMRLDIDNMSYEELLALEDRMGSVSTALSEDAFTKCVKKTIYQTTSLEVNMDGDEDEDEAESKCSICQEEYAIGDEIGRLGCEHGYHVKCLQQWLQLKNWCPVCKKAAAAAATQTS